MRTRKKKVTRNSKKPTIPVKDIFVNEFMGEFCLFLELCSRNNYLENPVFSVTKNEVVFYDANGLSGGDVIFNILNGYADEMNEIDQMIIESAKRLYKIGIDPEVFNFDSGWGQEKIYPLNGVLYSCFENLIIFINPRKEYLI